MAKNTKKINVSGTEITLIQDDIEEFVSLTDIAKHKNPEAPADIVKNWLRNKNTIELLGLWEKLNNPDFKLVEFDQFKNQAGFNHFVLSPMKRMYSMSPCLVKQQSNGAMQIPIKKAISETIAMSHNLFALPT